MIYHIFKDRTFITVERDAKIYTRYVRGDSFVSRRYTKGIPSVSKMVYKLRGRGWTWVRSLPVENFVVVEHPPPPNHHHPPENTDI